VTATGAFDVATLYRRYSASVVRRASQILRSSDDACEVLQEVFARLIARPDMLRRADHPATFLYVATTNACLNRLRDRRNRERLVEREVLPWIDELAPGSNQDRAIALDLLAKLPEDEASAAIYYYLDGMTHTEIAGALGCSRRHVGDLLERVQSHARGLAEEAV
jgi:RNA polymerase sigma factor (sigma-70 family)